MQKCWKPSKNRIDIFQVVHELRDIKEKNKNWRTHQKNNNNVCGNIREQENSLLLLLFIYIVIITIIYH